MKNNIVKFVDAEYLFYNSIEGTELYHLLKDVLRDCISCSSKNKTSYTYYLDMDCYSDYIIEDLKKVLIKKGIKVEVFNDYQERCWNFYLSWSI